MIYLISCIENSFVTYEEAFYVTVRTSHIVISDPLSKQKIKKKKMNIKLKIQNPKKKWMIMGQNIVYCRSA